MKFSFGAVFLFDEIHFAVRQLCKHGKIFKRPEHVTVAACWAVRHTPTAENGPHIFYSHTRIPSNNGGRAINIQEARLTLSRNQLISQRI
jgi:hypothetical protein